EETPFDEVTLAYKVGGRIFCLAAMDDTEKQWINVKCDPERAVILRERYPDAVLPGYHMNKVHWNTIHSIGLPDRLVREWLRDSYDLVAASLPRKVRKILG
ncbi:MAG: MmcQ/YjbR family DNA-binding protein, partial [Rikenellaceae bacterium]|nr:MmcQ/YjbR family DNA-binding protein [Rikenellaceae bacterium]